jgi:hypothetical protein
MIRLVGIGVEAMMKPFGTGQTDESQPQAQHQDASHPATHPPQTYCGFCLQAGLN